MKRILLLLCVSIILLGCSNPEKELDIFSALSINIELKPDSVLHELDSLKNTTSLSKLNEARWNLWYVRAYEEKTYELPSDSIVLAATDLLCEKGSLKEQAYSYFYLGRLNAAKEKDIKKNDAVAFYLKALKMAEEAQEYRLAGLICSYMNDIYKEESRYDKGIEILKDAVHYFNKSRNVRSQIFALKDISNNFLYNHLTDSSLIYCVKAESLARQINDKNALASILHAQATIYWLEKDFETAEFYVKKAMDVTTDSLLKEKEILLYININIGLRKYNVAKEYLYPFFKKDNTLSGKAYNFLNLSKIEEGLGNYDSALIHYKKYMELYDSLTNRQNEINTLKVEMKMGNENYQQNINKSNRNVAVSVILCFILLVLSSFLFVLHRKKVKQNHLLNVEVKNLKEDQHMLKNELLINSEQLHKMSLFSSVPSHKQKELKEEMEQFLLSSKVTPDDWTKLEKYINLSQDDFMSKLRNTYPTLSEDEIHMLILIRLGWDNNQLALFYNIKIETVMTKRSRARGKLKLKREDDLDEFMQNLFNQ